MVGRRKGPAGRDAILRVVRRVRRRWRARVALRGLAVAAVAGLLVALVSAQGMERFAFSPGAVTGFRIAAWLVVALVIAGYVLLPLARRVSDEQVALYLEEHEPSLEAALVSALDAAADRGPGRAHSDALVRRLVEAAVERCRGVEDGRRIERRSLRRSYGALAGAGLVGALLLLFGPGHLRHGASALLFPLRSADAASPYSIDVRPGHVTVPRGADQAITATLHGFTTEIVDLLARTDGGTEFERVPMVPSGDSAEFEVLLFDLGEATDYFVQAGGVRTAVFRIDVADLPHVERLELEYRFPDYTGLAPRTVERGGDVAVLRGTEVVVRAFPNMATPGGRLFLGDSLAAPLTPSGDGSLVGSFRVLEDGFYRLELAGPDGASVPASPTYVIDALSDQPPSVRIVKPGRDFRASPVEEVFVEVQADDDFGIGRVDLIYSVNGGPEDTLSVFRSASRPLKEVSAGHTFFLEEWELEPGDVIAYHARAFDDDRVAGRKAVTSDIYFLQVRPFSRDFRQAESRGMPQGGGGGGPESALSELQKQVIAGTFNVVRDRDRTPEADYRESLVTLALAQGRLREQVETLVARMTTRRGVLDADPGFRSIADILPRAIEEMRAAEEQLREERPREALPPEQRALQHLQRAEETYREVQVSFEQGGGGSGSSAEDLADLFQLELDKLKNQYETVQRGRQQDEDRQIDETLERLKELARRQQQEVERQRRLAGSPQGGAGGGAQRGLAEETEETARQLERLARESGSRDLMDTALQLQEAAQEMRRSASGSGNERASAAAEARERLEEARRLLEGSRSGRLERDARDALRRAEELADAQREVASEARRLGAPGTPGREDRLRRLHERKQEMAGEVGDLERQIDRAAAGSRREQPEASRRLTEAADAIRDHKIREKIQYSRSLIQGRWDDYVGQFEDQIGQDLEDLRDRLAEAVEASGTPRADPAAEALDRTRDLVRGLESMEERTRERGEEAERARRLDRRGQAGAPDSEAEGRTGAEGGQPRDGSAPGSERGGQPAGGAEAGGQPAGDAEAGGQAAGGAEAGGPAGGARAGGGGPRGPADGAGPRGALGEDEIRQLRRELRERRSEAEDLQRRLGTEGLDVEGLSDVIRAMRRLDDARVWADWDELARLQGALVEEVKRFEYALRRALEGSERERLFLSGSDEVPEGFRELVEEYYRALSRGRNP